MNKKDLKIWTKALRSGEYEQCSESLHRNGRFCCLGVAIDVLVEGDWKPNHPSFSDTLSSNMLYSFNNEYMFDGATGYPTSKTLSKIGISEPIARKLANFNDNGKSFKWIASWIERNAHRLDEE